MRPIIIALLAGMIFLGWVRRPRWLSTLAHNLNSPYAPVNEASLPGIIRYLNEGARPVKEARRNDAYRHMHEACGGKYKILREGPRSEGGVIVPAGNVALTLNRNTFTLSLSALLNSSMLPNNALKPTRHTAPRDLAPSFR